MGMAGRKKVEHGILLAGFSTAPCLKSFQKQHCMRHPVDKQELTLRKLSVKAQMPVGRRDPKVPLSELADWIGGKIVEKILEVEKCAGVD